MSKVSDAAGPRPEEDDSTPRGDATATAATGDRRRFGALADALGYAADRDYTGWDYADGMSSRVRRALPVENRWVNLAVQESVKRSPVNVRPLLLVEQRRNFMGAGLFALTHRIVDDLPWTSDRVDHPLAPDRVDHGAAAVRLAEWLVDERCRGYAGFCGGHRHRNQHLDHVTTPDEPDVVATAYAVKGLLAAAEYEPEYAGVARTAEDFVVEDMNYREVDGGAKVDYYPKDTADHYTLNAGAVAAGALLDLYDYFGDEALRERATALLDYVVARQTDAGGWYYRDPPSASHLSMDTHHNGFVVENLQRYHAVTGDQRYADALDDALAFVRNELFDASGAPNWDESSAYPKDVHAAAQGVLVFSRAGDLAFARRIADWTLANLYSGDGRFHVRQYRWFTKRITLMRWCQAWSCVALATLLFAASREGPDAIEW